MTTLTVAQFLSHPHLAALLAAGRLRVTWQDASGGTWDVAAVEVAPRVSTALKPYVLSLRRAHEYKIPPRAVSGDAALTISEVDG